MNLPLEFSKLTANPGKDTGTERNSTQSLTNNQAISIDMQTKF